MGAVEDDGSSLFDVVVRIRRLSIHGMRSLSCSFKSPIGVEAATGIDRVAGKLRPGKDVNKTLIIGEPMLVRRSTLQTGLSGVVLIPQGVRSSQIFKVPRLTLNLKPAEDDLPLTVTALAF